MRWSGWLILRTLEATGQNKTRSAEILGVSLKTCTTSSSHTASPAKTRLADLRSQSTDASRHAPTRPACVGLRAYHQNTNLRETCNDRGPPSWKSGFNPPSPSFSIFSDCR